MSATQVETISARHTISATLSVTAPDHQTELEEQHDSVLNTVRCLIADICQQYNGGHPGSAMGMASLGIALYKYVMRYSPSNPNYFNRDRLVLSNGHGCLWQYVFMHLTGFPNMTMNQLKSYHSAAHDSVCNGHPEIQFEGIEVSTGPLGQGLANAVGLAVAAKQLAAVYNRPDHELIDNMTWCIVGDGCLQEGVALEAVQLAGHWRLDNLAVIYDNNAVTCVGTLDVATTENINAKMEACGWHVIDVFDGVSDVMSIVSALQEASEYASRPTFINMRTVIGAGAWFAGQNKAHGSALGQEGVATLKHEAGLDPQKHFCVEDSVYDFFKDAEIRGKMYEKRFVQIMHSYATQFPELAAELQGRIEGRLPPDWNEHIPRPEELPTQKTPSRISAGNVVARLAKRLRSFTLATCDLQPATNMSWEGYVPFQYPELETVCGTMTGDYAGRYLHCGIREHATAAIASGLAAYSRGTIIPVTSAFFMFYSYAVPAVRMGALQGLQAIHLATHDSIAIGHDGPTHQPIELPALFRAMPNLLYIRPCDGEETCGAFISALEATGTPTMISLSRHGLVQYPEHSDRQGVSRGAYVFIEQRDADVTLIGVGSEMVFAVETRERLAEAGIKARIVSFPCQRLFDQQKQDYRESVMQYKSQKPVVVIEAYAVNGWERYADAGFSMRTFGKSLPAEDEIYSYFGFRAVDIASKIQGLHLEIQEKGLAALRGNFRDLNGGAMGYGFVPQ